MDIRAKIEEIRSLMYTLENWDELLQEKRRAAAWGSGRGYDAAKVQTTRKHDRLENAVLNVDELERHRSKLFSRYWDEIDEAMKLIEQHSPVDDWGVLHKYMLGRELSEIPLKGKQTNPRKVLDRAITRLQAALDREEMIARFSEGVRKLIEGGERKCKHCESGIVRLEKEEKEK